MKKLIQQAIEGVVNLDDAKLYCKKNNLEHSDLWNIMALHIAREFHSGSLNYEDADVAANSIWMKMIPDDAKDGFILPEPAYSIFCAFDEGEYNHGDDSDPVETITKPKIEKILKEAEPVPPPCRLRRRAQGEANPLVDHRVGNLSILKKINMQLSELESGKINSCLFSEFLEASTEALENISDAEIEQSRDLQYKIEIVNFSDEDDSISDLATVIAEIKSWIEKLNNNFTKSLHFTVNTPDFEGNVYEHRK